MVVAKLHAIDWKTSSHGIWAMDCDFRENNLKNVRSKGEECSQRCLETSGCTHYTWNNYNDGTCWMKKGQVSKEKAFSANGVVCGINGDNSSGHSSSGGGNY